MKSRCNWCLVWDHSLKGYLMRTFVNNDNDQQPTSQCLLTWIGQILLWSRELGDHSMEAALNASISCLGMSWLWITSGDGNLPKPGGKGGHCTVVRRSIQRHSRRHQATHFVDDNGSSDGCFMMWSYFHDILCWHAADIACRNIELCTNWVMAQHCWHLPSLMIIKCLPCCKHQRRQIASSWWIGIINPRKTRVACELSHRFSCFTEQTQHILCHIQFFLPQKQNVVVVHDGYRLYMLHTLLGIQVLLTAVSIWVAMLETLSYDTTSNGFKARCDSNGSQRKQCANWAHGWWWEKTLRWIKH